MDDQSYTCSGDHSDRLSCDKSTIAELESRYFYSVNKLGVIADIQYCDEDDIYRQDIDQYRRYRETLNVTRRAAKCFEEVGVGAVLQLGDAIDEKSKHHFITDFTKRVCPLLEIPSYDESVFMNCVQKHTSLELEKGEAS